MPDLQKLFFAVLLCCSWMFPARTWAQCSSYGGSQLGLIVPATRTSTTVNTVTASNYVRVAVIRGIQYTVSSTLNNLAVTDSSGGSPQASSGTSLIYTAVYSGYIRLYNCNASAVNLSVSIPTSTTAIGGSNTEDSKTAAGTNGWREHLYQRLDNTGGVPTDVNAFSRYLGYRDTITGETFTNSFVGPGGTYALKSGGRYLILNTPEFFAVQYRMQSTRPAGAYLADMNGDDGVRLTVDGTLYFNRWREQSNSFYTKQLFPLSGNSNLLFEYYESTGGNDVGFTNFSRVSNAISGPGPSTDTTVCNNTAISFSGNNTFSDAPISAASIISVAYQWAVSANGNAYTNISGATTQNYSTGALSPGTYQYRRTATISRFNSGMQANDSMPTKTSVPDLSNIIKVTVRPTPAATLTSGGSVCRNAIANLTVTNPQTIPVTVNYSSSGTVTGSGSVVVPGSGTATIPFSTTTPGSSTVTLTNVAYTTTPSCSTALSGVTTTVTVRPLPAGTITTNTPICLGAAGRLTFTSTSGTSPFSIIVNGTTYNGIVSGTPFNITPNPATSGTLSYDLTKITDANGCVSP
ncbi:MAG: hypothetical protein EOP52_06395 [Sphingobacteriales bacterium]|nr:MAG: hypothetical protein EOP52_06395 [Sphingobacteriales bacterium]